MPFVNVPLSVSDPAVDIMTFDAIVAVGADVLGELAPPLFEAVT